MGSVTKLPVKFLGHGQLVPPRRVEFKGFVPGEEPDVRYNITVGEFKSVIRITLDSGVQFGCYSDTIMLALKTDGVMLLKESMEEFSSFVNNVFMKYVKKFIISYHRKNGREYYEMELSF